MPPSQHCRCPVPPVGLAFAHALAFAAASLLTGCSGPGAGGSFDGGDLGPSPDGGGLPALSCTPRSPPTGAAPGTNQLMPGAQRLRTALSTDGLRWTRTDTTIADQAATPSLVLSAAGRPLLYYTAHRVDGMSDGAAVAVGTPDGTSFTHCTITVTGLPAGARVVDPDVLRLSSGAIRLYFTAATTTGQAGKLGIHYAESDDGLVFAYGGLAFEQTSSILDSMTFEAGGTFHQYALSGNSIAMVHGTSSDGKRFTFVDSAERTLGGQPYVLSQTARVGSELRVYGFGPMGKELRSFTTTGPDLVADPTLLLALDPAATAEKTFIKDPAVTRLSTGEYLMAYSTVIP